MFNPNEDGPISPMKKLKILAEKQVNVIKPLASFDLIKKEKFSASNNQQQIKEVINEAEELTATTGTEPLLQEAPGQYVIFPINHKDMWGMYKELVDNFWSFTETIQELDKLALSYNETRFFKIYSSIFASTASCGLVNENFAEEFCRLIQVTEAKFFYGHQLFVQNIHYEMYNKLLDHFAPNAIEKEKMFKTVEGFDSVINKRNLVAQWKNLPFGEQLMASACLHGIFFSSLDLIFSWLKNRNQNKFNHEIIDIFQRMVTDQNLQRDFSCLMIGHLKNKPPKEKIIETINQSAKIEFDFLLNGLSADLIEIETQEIIQLIDKKTKELKSKIFEFYDEEKKQISQNENGSAKRTVNDEENSRKCKENHQKISFDEDF